MLINLEENISFCRIGRTKGANVLNKDREKYIENLIVEKKLEEFSAERRKFIEETKHDEILVVILKTHLYIEKELNELITQFFKNPQKLLNYKFKSKLDLLFALGVIEQELYDPIAKINDIRNDFGHKLNYTFSEGEYVKLHNTLSKEVLTEFKKDLDFHNFLWGKRTFLEETKILLAGIWSNLKSDVLFSYNIKNVLSLDYKIDYNDMVAKLIKEEKGLE